jgi:Arc/MetJ-type ribon-helix-helix transcriptional regulator
MAATERLIVDLPSDLLRNLRNSVQAGEFASEGEAIEAVLRAWYPPDSVEEPDLEMFRASITEGIADADAGRVFDADEMFKRLHERIALIQGKNGTMSTVFNRRKACVNSPSNRTPGRSREAKKIVARLKRKPKDEVIFEIGYGPRACRTSGPSARSPAPPWSATPSACSPTTGQTRLIAFSDDMDGSAVPDNVPNREMMASHLGKPLSRVPDPFSNERFPVRRRQQCPAARLPRPVRI